jgi:histidine triad (HIT) family protein
MSSIFSRIVNGEIPCYKVAEDEHHLAFLDILPVAKGHILVIPKKEIDKIWDLPEHEFLSLHLFANRVAKKMESGATCAHTSCANE